MIMAGGFQTLAGLVALFQDEFYVATRNYLLQFDATSWGWIHLLLGLMVLFAGFAVLSGTDLGTSRRHHAGRAQRPVELRFHPVLPVLGAGDHRTRRLRHLGAGRTRTRHHRITQATAGPTAVATATGELR